MELGLLLIVLGILIAVLVHSGLGVAFIVIGLILLLLPHIRTG